MPINKYVITKQLTKRPDDYPDAKSQPHVQARGGVVCVLCAWAGVVCVCVGVCVCV